jgi:hypothetical protein
VPVSPLLQLLKNPSALLCSISTSGPTTCAAPFAISAAPPSSIRPGHCRRHLGLAPSARLRVSSRARAPLHQRTWLHSFRSRYWCRATKMDVTNAAGRKVSLLNDHEPHHQLTRLHSFTPSLRSRTSSYASSPIGSPPTPQLVRSNSADSASMHSSAHSPVTPDFSMDGSFLPSLESPTFSQNGFFAPHKDMNSVYAQLPSASGPLAYHHPPPAQLGYFPQPPPLEQQQQQQQQPDAAASTTSNGRPKKNSYPCPMAKAYNCGDFFTTSGHAARHAKKHTGKKDACCPECNKTFTRKDNMEQHRRTHQNGRNATKAGDRDTRKAKKQARRPTPAPLQSSEPIMAPLPMVDLSMPISPAGPYLASAVQPTDPYMDFSQRTSYPDPTAFSMTTAYNSPSSYHGLDALAIAASGEKRKFEL